MSDRTGIAWSDATWNPIIGCSRVSPGCASCYAIKVAWRLSRNPKTEKAYERVVFRHHNNGNIDWTGRIQVLEDRIDLPKRWKKPRRIFVTSESDLYHESVPTVTLERIWRVMLSCPQHTFQVLTKRADLMNIRTRQVFSKIYGDYEMRNHRIPHNIWMMISAESQQNAKVRIPQLLQLPATIYGLSLEPLLSQIDLTDCNGIDLLEKPLIDWVIVGGESGGAPWRQLVEACWCSKQKAYGTPKAHQGCFFCNGTGWKPKDYCKQWVRKIRDDCESAGVPFFFKQWGGARSTSAGKHLDGRIHEEMPEWETR